MKNFLTELAYIICIVPMALFSYDVHFEGRPLTTHYWHLWVKASLLIGILALAMHKTGRLKLIGMAISLMLLLRLVWQFFELENYFLANKPYVLDWLFAFIMLCVLFIIFIADSKKIYIYLKRKVRWRN